MAAMTNNVNCNTRVTKSVRPNELNSFVKTKFLFSKIKLDKLIQIN